jgi:hypothetical protein
MAERAGAAITEAEGSHVIMIPGRWLSLTCS